MIKQDNFIRRLGYRVKKLLVREGWLMREISKDFLVDALILLTMVIFAWFFVEVLVSTLNLFNA